MTDRARRKLARRRRVGVYHCWNRCVRRAFLCGKDPFTGKDFSHRRDWILKREEQLARLFAIEVEFHAELSNHLHLILRTRPDIARRWSREEVARRWLTITRLAKCMSDGMPQPSTEKIEELVKDKKRIRKIRRRLSKVSWFMAILSENIARRANDEDECSGRFWGTRYRCRECTDVNSILLCGIYVDLNPIKAGEATSPQTARYTSAYQRMHSQSQRKNGKNRPDGWLGELTWQDDTSTDEAIAFSSRTGRRASDKGLIPISLEDYLKLLNWSARQLRAGQRTTIPGDLESVLDHLSINEEAWLDTLESYEDAFCHVVGSPAEIRKAAERMGRRCLKGTSAGKRIFG